MKLTLYGFRKSSATYRVKNVLNHKGIPFEQVEIDLIKFQHQTEQYRKVNPALRVPCLHWTEGQTEQYMYESQSICDFLEEKFKQGAPLFPKDLL